MSFLRFGGGMGESDIRGSWRPHVPQEGGQTSGKEDIHLLVFRKVVHEGLGDEKRDPDKEGFSYICVGAGQW